MDILLLTFRHLYDTHWGVIYKTKTFHGSIQKWVIFPQDFQPVTGKSYECTIQWTQSGVFRYKGQTYRVGRAHLKTKGSIIDEIDHKYKERKKALSPMAVAFQKALQSKKEKVYE